MAAAAAAAAKAALLQWEERLQLSPAERRATLELQAAVDEALSPQHAFTTWPGQAADAPAADAHDRVPAAATTASDDGVSCVSLLRTVLTVAPDGARGGAGVRPEHSRYREEVLGHAQALSDILAGLERVQEDLGALQAHHESVSVKTTEVRTECQQLLRQQQDLVESARRLRLHLSFFSEADHVAAKLDRPAQVLSMASGAELGPLLARLEECLAYMRDHADFKEARKYRAIFRQLHLKVLNGVKQYFTASIQAAADRVLLQKRPESGAGVDAHAAGSAMAFVEFRAVAASLRAPLAELETRCSSSADGGAAATPYRTVAQQCLAAYAAQRDLLLRGDVERYIELLARSHALPDLTRQACLYLMEINALEYQLFGNFFNAAAVPTAADTLMDILSRLCGVLYTQLRPLVIRELQLDTLCQVISVLRDVADEQLAPRGESMAALLAVLRRVSQDVQERLAYRAQVCLREEVQGFAPSPAHLDYPGRLEAAAAGQGPRDMYASWYPPLERTLLCLSKLFRSVEVNVFQALAQEAVAVCTSTLLEAHRLVAARSGPVHGQLFLIMHLLVLREQISPFKVDFVATEHALDLSHVADLIPALFRRREALRSWRAFFEIVQTSEPRIVDHQTDSKKVMEQELKKVCEAFIHAQTRQLAGPLLELLQRHDPHLIAAAATTPGSKDAEAASAAAPAVSAADAPRVRGALVDVLRRCVGDGALDADPSAALAAAAAAPPEQLAACLAGRAADASLAVRLAALQRALRLYVANPVTRQILFKPIRTNLAEALQQVRLFAERALTPSDPEAARALAWLERLASALE